MTTPEPLTNSEADLETWMNRCLEAFHIDDVKAEYRPGGMPQPVYWAEDMGHLVIHEPDPQKAAALFLVWLDGELPRQRAAIMENLKVVSGYEGPPAAHQALIKHLKRTRT